MLGAMDWPIAYRVGVLLLLMVHGVFVETRPRQPCLFRFQAKGRAAIWHDGDWLNAVAVRPSLIHPWLSVFSVTQPSGQIQRWVVLPDSCSSDDFRRLRVWLKWESQGAAVLPAFQNTIPRA